MPPRPLGAGAVDGPLQFGVASRASSTAVLPASSASTSAAQPAQGQRLTDCRASCSPGVPVSVSAVWVLSFWA